MATTTELEALLASWQAAEKEEQRIYEELCDAEQEFERNPDALHKVLVEQIAHQWDLACTSRSDARRAYNKAADPVGWQRIRDCIDLREQNK